MTRSKARNRGARSCSGVVLGLGALLALHPVTAGRSPFPDDLPPSTSGPTSLAFSPDGRRAAVTLADNNSVAVIDTATRRLVAEVPTGGAQPDGLAFLSASQLLVSNQYDGTASLLDVSAKKPVSRIRLPGGPAGVVVDLRANCAYIALSQLNQVVRLGLPRLEERGRLTVGRRPLRMELSADGSLLFVAGSQDGSVTPISTTSFTSLEPIQLTGINVRGLALAPGGTTAYATGQIPANTRVTREPLDIWTNTVFAIDLRPKAVARSAEGWIDFTGAPSPDPAGVAALSEDRAIVALSGSDEVLQLRAPKPRMRTYDPVITRRVRVGFQPSDVRLSPDRREVWVTELLGSSVAILDAETLEPRGRIRVPAAAADDLRMPGRYLFGSARLTRGGQFSCNSCHPGLNTDGLTWQFVHVPDGMQKRNSRNLRGGVNQTAPFRWSGHDAEIEQFFQEEITGLLGGEAQPHPVLHALWNLIERSPMPPSPHRSADGSLTAPGKRGKELFNGKAGCGGCHMGSMWGGTGNRAHVGTTLNGKALDVPHLKGAYDTAPYLHDGRALTLESVFEQHNAAGLHGKAAELSRSELADLLAFVRQL